MHVSEILKVIPTLSIDEINKIQSGIQAAKALGVNGTAHEESNSDTDLILSSISDTLLSMGTENCNPWILKRSSQYKAFKEKVPYLIKYLDRAGIKTKINRQAILSIAIKLLYQNLIDMNQSPSSRTLMAQIHRIPAVLNQHFPGYAGACMLSWVIKAK